MMMTMVIITVLLVGTVMVTVAMLDFVLRT